MQGISCPLQKYTFDGRPLYAYSYSKSEWEQLFSSISNIDPQYLGGHRKDYFWITFALCAAHKASIDYKDSYSWSFFEDIACISNIKLSDRYSNLYKAFKTLGREIQHTHGGSNQYLASLIVEGGLPLAWLEVSNTETITGLMRSMQNLASKLKKELSETSHLKADVFLTVEEVKEEVEAHSWMPQMWRNEAIYNMIADLFNGFIICLQKLPISLRSGKVNEDAFERSWNKEIEETGLGEELLPTKFLTINAKLKLLKLLTPALEALEPGKDDTSEWLTATPVFDTTKVLAAPLVKTAQLAPLDEFAALFNIPLSLMKEGTKFAINDEYQRIARGHIKDGEVVLSDTLEFTCFHNQELTFKTPEVTRTVWLSEEILPPMNYQWDKTEPLYLSCTPLQSNQNLYEILGVGSATLRQNSCKVILNKKLLSSDGFESKELDKNFVLLNLPLNNQIKYTWHDDALNISYNLHLGAYRPQKLTISTRDVDVRIGIYGTAPESHKEIVFHELPSVYFRNERIKPSDNRIRFKVTGNDVWHPSKNMSSRYGFIKIGYFEEGSSLIAEAEFLRLPKDFRLKLVENNGEIEGKIKSNELIENEYSFSFSGYAPLSPLIKGKFSIHNSHPISFIASNPSDFFFICTETREEKTKSAKFSQLIAGEIDAQLSDTQNLQISGRLIDGTNYQNKLQLHENERIFPLTCASRKFSQFFYSFAYLIDPSMPCFRISSKMETLNVDIENRNKYDLWWEIDESSPDSLQTAKLYFSAVLLDNIRKSHQHDNWPVYNLSYENRELPTKLKQLWPHDLNHYERKFLFAPLYASLICQEENFPIKNAHDLMELTTIRLFDPDKFDEIYDIANKIMDD